MAQLERIKLAGTRADAPEVAVVEDLRPHDGSQAAAASAQVAAPVGALLVAGLSMAWWLIAVAREWGGRNPDVVSIGAVITIAALLEARPDRHLPLRFNLIALAMSAGAVAVALFSPTGWAGASTASSYVCAAWSALAIAAVARRDPDRTGSLLMVVGSFAVMIEFAEDWLAWWGGRNAAEPMIGTFYWHDPYGAFMGVGALLALGLWLHQDRRIRSLAPLGLITFWFGTAGVVFSTSRAMFGAWGVGLGILVLLAVARREWTQLIRMGIAGVTSIGFCFLISGPPFFTHRAGLLSAEQSRASNQSLSQNGGYRLDFWREAWRVFTHHPIVGGGYHSLSTLSVHHVPFGWPLSPLAHNGYLQALSDGGLVLALPLYAALLVATWRALQQIWLDVRGRTDRRWLTVISVTLLVALLHSGVDFDWSYAADMLFAALLAGVVLGAARPAASARSSRLGLAVLGTATGLLVVAAVAGWHGDLTQNLPIKSAHSVSIGRVEP